MFFNCVLKPFREIYRVCLRKTQASILTGGQRLRGGVIEKDRKKWKLNPKTFTLSLFFPLFFRPISDAIHSLSLFGQLASVTLVHIHDWRMFWFSGHCPHSVIPPNTPRPRADVSFTVKRPWPNSFSVSWHAAAFAGMGRGRTSAFPFSLPIYLSNLHILLWGSTWG